MSYATLRKRQISKQIKEQVFNRYHTYVASANANEAKDLLFNVVLQCGWDVDHKYVNETVDPDFECVVVYKYGQQSLKEGTRNILLRMIKHKLNVENFQYHSLYWYEAEDEKDGFKYWRLQMDIKS